MKKNSGFTLAEILVVIGVLSIMGVLVLTIFTRSLRGNNKSQIISAIKENGQSILESLDKTIRNADNVVCIRTTSMPNSMTISSLTYVKDGVYTRFRIRADSSKVTTGFIQQDKPVPSQQETADPKLFVERVCDPNNPMFQAIVLTDTNTQTGISLVNGAFNVNKQAGFKDVINIRFVLAPGKDAPSSITGQIDPVTFETTIQLR